jgi:rubrerythrin
MKTPYFIEKIDWSELRKQKASLLSAITNAEQTGNDEFTDDLNGILSLIDAVQDYAVDEMNMNPVDIYDFEQEEERDEETPEEKFARENAKTIFEMHIEGSFIYENEVMSEEFIKSIIDDEQHATAIKNIIRLAILEDVQNGTHTSLEYNIEMYDYGYKIEDYCMEQFYKDKTKTLWLCPICGSDNVQFKTWTNANTFQATDDECPMEDDDCHCKDCESNGTLIHQEMPFLKKVIGFQVVSNPDGEFGAGHIHPEMDGSFCIYSLSQAKKMMDGNDDWKLLTIWSGDIENPVIMFGFENKPRD